MTFPYPINVNVPNAPNAPRNDQQPMKVNYANINGFLSVDHTAPGTNPGAGFHNQVTYNNQNIPGVQVNPLSVGFTSLASAIPANATGSTSAVVQEFYRNQDGIFPNMAVRAFGTIATVIPPAPPPAPPATTPQNILNAFNVVSVVRNNATPNYTIVLVTNSTYKDDYAVLVSSTRTGGGLVVISNYVITNVTTFNLEFFSLANARVDPTEFSFIVLQT